MSILIKGMEMPTVGYIDVRIKCNGTASFAIADNPYFKAVEAVHVPPHGRLGDLDELYKEALKRSETKDGYYNCLEPVISCYTIDNAPTIVPAEPSVAEAEIQSEFLQNWHEEGE